MVTVAGGRIPYHSEPSPCRVRESVAGLEVSVFCLLKHWDHALMYRHLQVQNHPHCILSFFPLYYPSLSYSELDLSYLPPPAQISRGQNPQSAAKGRHFPHYRHHQDHPHRSDHRGRRLPPRPGIIEIRIPGKDLSVAGSKVLHHRWSRSGHETRSPDTFPGDRSTDTPGSYIREASCRSHYDSSRLHSASGR